MFRVRGCDFEKVVLFEVLCFHGIAPLLLLSSSWVKKKAALSGLG
jgi:hypothetical protein